MKVNKLKSATLAIISFAHALAAEVGNINVRSFCFAWRHRCKVSRVRGGMSAPEGQDRKHCGHRKWTLSHGNPS